jgi:hypothetical protein
LVFGITVQAGAAGAVQVSASVDRTRVVGGESLTLTVTVDGGKGDVNVDGIRDFKVVSRGTSSSINIVNGSMSSRTDYAYTLMPLKKGPLVIPPLPVTVGGKTIYTEMISVEVSDAPQTTGAPQDEDVFIRMSVSDKAPWLGEQITCRLSLYNAVQIANAALTAAPEFPGFSAEKLPDNRNYSRVVGGRRFDVTELVYVLTPEEAGEHTLGPAVISCDVVVRGSSRGNSLFDSFFNDPFFGGGHNLRHRRLTADPVNVKVRPLPEYSGNEPFSGLVGEFAISAEMDQTTITEGESANMAVIISGRGNIQAASSPGFKLPDAFKVYEDTPVEEIAASDAGVSGKKRFPAAIVALTPGRYTVGPFSLTYFDVNRESYITISTTPIEITVKASDKKAAGNAGNIGAKEGEPLPRPVRKQAVEFTGHDIFPLKQNLSALDHQGTVPIQIFLLLIGGPFLLYGIAAVVVTRIRRKIDDRTLMCRKARSALKSAGNGRLAIEERLDLLFKAVVYAVYARAGRKGESLTYREARQMLCENGCDETVTDNACCLLEEIEQARYGGRRVDVAFLEKTMAAVGSMIRRIMP